MESAHLVAGAHDRPLLQGPESDEQPGPETPVRRHHPLPGGRLTTIAKFRHSRAVRTNDVHRQNYLERPARHHQSSTASRKAGSVASRGSRVVVVGPAPAAELTAEDGSARSTIEVVAEEPGPGLRWVTATTTKVSVKDR